MLDDTRKALAPTQAEINALPMSSNGKMARELIGERKGRALDIGCGEGKFTRGLASHIAEVSGIDVKANKIAEAREAARRSGVQLSRRDDCAKCHPPRQRRRRYIQRRDARR